MKLKKTFALLILVLTVFISQSLFAQTTDYSNVKVDDLTDAQIRELITKAESIGYDDSQLEQMAAAQGLPDAEIKKLRIRVDNIRSQGTNASSADAVAKPVELNRKRDFNPGDSLSKAGSSATPVPTVTPQVPIFGAALFKNANLTFEPNLRMATPKSYVIGPDDDLLIDITGDNEASYKPRVSPDGTIKIQYVGLIS